MEPKKMEMTEVEIWTITRMGKDHVVMLRPLDSDLVVPVYISQLEARSILTGTGEIKQPWPLTPDLVLSLLAYTGLFLHRIEISTRNDGFQARIVISGGQTPEKRPLTLNTKPAEAFSLAVRQKCPVYISRRSLNSIGIPSEFILAGAAENGGLPAPRFPEIKMAVPIRSGKYQSLREELRQAVDSEEYERAAEIRDQLLLLEKDGKA
jgi:bifunctional DNase/RNase